MMKDEMLKRRRRKLPLFCCKRTDLIYEEEK